MVFSSAIFLFLFLPVFLSIYYLLPFRVRSAWILIGSLVFYGWWRVDFMFVMLGVILWSYLVAWNMIRTQGTGQEKKWLAAGVGLNLATLGFFKYFNFGVDSMNMLLKDAGFESIEAIRILLPIGISFYVFHAISFLVDIYRRDAKLPKNFFDFAAFITLFPQLVAGPILRFKDLAYQFEDRTHSWDKFSMGVQRFSIGFAKKILIADTVAPMADAAFALPDPTMADAWLGAIAYAIQLYFDFSAYSDMAVGLGLMMGFKFIENFNQPYLSKSITEFWRRWHISLSTWLRDYLYIPLGGNRVSKGRTYFNLIITMVLGGFWHGANWTFVIWGFWHGSIMAVERALGIKGSLDEVMPLARAVGKTAFCMLLVLLGWVIFRAENLDVAMDMYRGMAGMQGLALSDAYAWQIKGMSVAALALGISLVYLGPVIRRNATMIPRQAIAVALAGVFLLSVSRLLAQNYSPFLYFQF